MQHDQPDDFVIAAGEMHSVREFLDHASAHLEMDWRQFVEVDSRYLRPAEVDALCGDAATARNILGWSPSTSFHGLVRLMVEADVKELEDLTTGRAIRLTN